MERGHNKIPKLLLTSRISLGEKRGGKEARRDGWMDVGVGDERLMGELVARML